MKRFIPLVLAVLLLAGCQSSKQGQLVKQDQKEQALKMALSQACNQVPVNLFSSCTALDLLGPDASSLLEQGQIPLLQTSIEQYRKLCLQAFKNTLVQMNDIITSYTNDLIIENPTLTIASSNDRTSLLLDQQFGSQIKQRIKTILETELTESSHLLDSIINHYTIWNEGKVTLGYPSLALVQGRDAEAMASLFYTTYLAQLRYQEVDVRTTPRLKDTGSLYEFFAQQDISK